MVKIKKDQKGKPLYIAPLGEIAGFTGMILGFILFFIGIGGLMVFIITILGSGAWLNAFKNFPQWFLGVMLFGSIMLVPILGGLYFAKITRLKLYEKGFIPSIRPIKFLFRPNAYFISYDRVIGMEGIKAPYRKPIDELHIKLVDGRYVTCLAKEKDMEMVIKTFKKYCSNVPMETKIVRR